MRLLDLCCKAGGSAMGYYQSGLFSEIVGVDKKPQRHYPFVFVQADAVEYATEHAHEFDVIHASPPCQGYSNLTRSLWRDRLASHPDLITPLRPILKEAGKPYIMENVVGAPLHGPVLLCGSMFGLNVRRHRLFETNFHVTPPPCNHKAQGRVVQVNGHPGGSSKRDGIKFGGVAEWKDAMQIDWMTGAELAEAIPPAYTFYISKFIARK